MREVYDLIERVIPGYSNQFDCRFCSDTDGKDTYRIYNESDKIVLEGNNYISIAAALGQYLKYDAKVNISWCGCNKKLTQKLPAATEYCRVIEQKYRVYMNYCTFNYSASWWDFDRWEWEIDYMALNGINMPLSIVGIEAVWYKTLTELGFSDIEARSYLAGPAFSAWQWMGNLEGFGGPMPSSWINKRKELGKKILERQTKLGMTPIQHGFSGVVPQKFAELYPDKNMKVQEEWNGMKGTVQLDPTEPLFKEVGMRFLNNQKELLGAYGNYAADPFHEGKPPVDGSEYLERVGRVIHELFCEFDPDSKWIMQAWSIRKEIATSVPVDKLLILDLGGWGYESRDNFWGYEFVIGNLHNFGGRIKLHGDLCLLAESQYRTAHDKGATNAVGTGLFMEGIEHNPVYFDLAFEMLTKSRKEDISAWLDEYTIRRYGVDSQNAKKAWQILLKTAYAPGTNFIERGSAICTRPAVNLIKTGPGPGFLMPYGAKRLFEVVELLDGVNSDTEGYRFDIADVLRQYMSDIAYELQRDVAKSFMNREKSAFEILCNKYLELIDDFDDLLHTIPCYSFEKWITDALKWADNEEDARLLDYNATALVTIWGNDEDSILFDYAWREWSGLTRQYYKKRWEFFFDKLKNVLDQDGEYNEEVLKKTIDDRYAWRSNEVYDQMADMESEWIKTPKTFEHIYNDENVAQRLMDKYRPKRL